MDISTFVYFAAFLLLALFSVDWYPKFPYPRFRWVVFVLTCLSVLGAAWVLVMTWL